jgi:dTDP-4-dehydrorhamnose reductase
LLKNNPHNIKITGTYFKNKPKFSKVDLAHLDLSKVDDFIASQNQKYDCIIHCAAQANLGECDKNPQQAYLLNTVATEKLAQWSMSQKSRFIFLSTDIVFDGTRGYYSENDMANPVNNYGKSKLQAEERISKIHKNFVIVRLALCLGRGIDHTSSFIDYLISKLEMNKIVQLYFDEYRTPVSANYASNAIWKISLSDFKGIIHLAGVTRLNRYELAKDLIENLKVEKKHLLRKISSNTSEYPRPKDVSMKTDNLQQIINIQPEDKNSLIKNIS